MLDTFKARLKAKSTAAGVKNLSQKRIDALADKLNTKFPDITDEAEHDAKIGELYDDETLKEFAVLDDYHRGKSAKEKADKEKADKEKSDKEAADKLKLELEKQDPPKTDAEKLAALESKFGELADTVKKYQEKDLKAKLNETFQAKLAAKKIPIAFAKRFQIDSEDQMDELITEAETDYNTLVDGAAAEVEGVGNKDKPLKGSGGGENKKPSKEQLHSIVDKILP